jgi:hypothetical protein
VPVDYTFVKSVGCINQKRKRKVRVRLGLVGGLEIIPAKAGGAVEGRGPSF